jgi:hypothetical protein
MAIEDLAILAFEGGFLFFILILVIFNSPIQFIVASFAVFVIIWAFVVRTGIRVRTQG